MFQYGYKMIHSRLTVAILLTTIITLSSNELLHGQDFEEYLRQQQAGLVEMQTAYQVGVLQSVEAWEAYHEREIAAFESYKEEMERLWGEFKQRSQKDWVEYRDGGRVRTSVDFESGKGTVEIIAETPEEIEEATVSILDELLLTFNDVGSKREYPIENQEQEPISDEPILANQIDTSEATIEEVAEEIAQNVEIREVTGDDGINRSVIFVNFSLAPDHIQTRARKVEHYVNEYAGSYEIDPSLIFAIIHTESYYNPAAKSWANALGLMQLVPTSGGRDAYRAVYNEDGVPSQDYLFIPENNVRLGSAYIDILWSNYFRGVDDPLVRELLIISAYNTGAGNVA